MVASSELTFPALLELEVASSSPQAQGPGQPGAALSPNPTVVASLALRPLEAAWARPGPRKVWFIRNYTIQSLLGSSPGTRSPASLLPIACMTEEDEPKYSFPDQRTKSSFFQTPSRHLPLRFRTVAAPCLSPPFQWPSCLTPVGSRYEPKPERRPFSHWPSYLQEDLPQM